MLKMRWCGTTLLVSACLVWTCSSVFCGAKPSRDRNNKPFRVVCVHLARSFYRLGNGKFTVDDIDPSICTHLIYGYAGIHNNRIRSLDGYLDLEGDQGKGNYKKFNELREENPNLTTLLSVGGKTEGAIKFSEMAQDETKRKIFVQSCLSTLETYDFDGLNLDWQFPTRRGGVPEDKEHFTTLLQDLKTAFEEKGYVLAITVSAQQATIDEGYEVEKISKIVDFLNVLTYDYRQSGDDKTGWASPLFTVPQGNQEDTAAFSMDYWIKKGATPDKLVLGLSCYGQSWTLESGGGVQLPGSKASAPGETWPYTREAGIIGYNEFCESQKEMDWSVVSGKEEKVSFATEGDQWISFDDPKSVAEKAKYVLSNALGGVFIYGIESDDGKGICSKHKFPMVSAAYEILHGEVRPSPTTPTESTTTSRPPDDFQCTSVGFFRDPRDCTRYFQCIHSNRGGRYSIVVFSCGEGTAFDEKNTVCTWKHLVKECQ